MFLVEILLKNICLPTNDICENFIEKYSLQIRLAEQREFLLSPPLAPHK